MSENIKWSETTWNQTRIKTQMPKYNLKQLKQVKKDILTELNDESKYIVSIEEIKQFKEELKEAQYGKKFIIQGGDCAEKFKKIEKENVQEFISFFQRIDEVLSQKFAKEGINKEVINIGRIAGQFAKPRSEITETFEGKKILVYRGDIINNIDPTKRKPNPKNMMQAYKQSLETSKYIKEINKENLRNCTKMFVSHEALLLDYEECFIKTEKKYNSKKKIKEINKENLSNCIKYIKLNSDEVVLYNHKKNLNAVTKSSEAEKHYLISTHFPWLGERTKDLDGAHIEFLRGIDNPIGIKCGENTESEDLIKIIEKLNPENEDGKIVLIIRMGKDNIEECLPKLINTVKNKGLKVIWISDPMHGNTKKLEEHKVRYIEDILTEINSYLKICKRMEVIAGGLHLEMTNENIYECKMNEKDTNKIVSTSLCDPRLNKDQVEYIINNLKILNNNINNKFDSDFSDSESYIEFDNEFNTKLFNELDRKFKTNKIQQMQ